MRDYSKIRKPTPVRYCSYCGMLLERKRINGRIEDLGVFKRRKYCNRECMRRAFVKTNGASQECGPAHHSARRIAYLINKKDKVCEICGSTNNIDIHHKDGNYHNNDENNLMIVCRSCHCKLHRPKSTCKLCGKPVKGHGYCNTHYIRWKKFGDPLLYHGRKVKNNFFQERRKRKMFIETGPDADNQPTQLSLF